MKTPEITSSMNTNEQDASNNNGQSSSKKPSSQNRNQKFRSMDMTQNLLKKSMGQKGKAMN